MNVSNFIFYKPHSFHAWCYSGRRIYRCRVYFIFFLWEKELTPQNKTTNRCHVLNDTLIIFFQNLIVIFESTLDRLWSCYSCRLTLLLGPPSSGKTTLLLALAGRLGPGLQVLSFQITLSTKNGVSFCLDAPLLCQYYWKFLPDKVLF